MSVWDSPMYRKMRDAFNDRKLPGWTSKSLKGKTEDQLADYLRKNRNNVAAQDLVKNERDRRSKRSDHRWALFLALLAGAIVIAIALLKYYPQSATPNNHVRNNEKVIK